MASIVEQSESIKLNPRPGLVVKTRILEANKPSKYLISTKVFINICHDEQVPKPSRDFDPAVVFPLIINNQWEIPLIVSNEKHTKDKKGQPSLVYDCCINSVCFQWCQINSDLRSILIEWCIESIELLFELVLEREYSIPKMLSKGELSQTIVPKNELDESGFQKKLQTLKNNETLGLIEEVNSKVMDEDDNNELPDLKNIHGKKPLIEEINDMKISDTRQGMKKNQEPKLEPEKESEKLQRYNFNLNFQKLSGKHQLLVRLESSQLTPASVALMYKADIHSLVLKNLNNELYFSKSQKDTLVIALPKDIMIKENHELKSFYVRNENSLYIFV